MATQQTTVDFLMHQVAQAGVVRSRKMFGEYALYCDEKVVALICDDRLFVKPTDAGRAFVGTVEEAPPYPGSKAFLLIEEDRWENSPWLTELVAITARSLPIMEKKRR